MGWIKRVPVIIRKLDNEQAVIAMVDSNLQREKILPSEKAFAYKMRLEAMKHQGKVEKFMMDPVGPKWIDELTDTPASETGIEKNGKVNIKKANSLKGNRSNEQLARMTLDWSEERFDEEGELFDAVEHGNDKFTAF